MAGAALAALLHSSHGGVVVVSGAGISTSAGIPDYRSPARPAYRPLQHAEFLQDAYVRRRYWARSVTGWDRFRSARPTAAHWSCSALQAAGVVSHSITQNVVRLHSTAGASPVLELHGCLHEVECLTCGAQLGSRDDLQRSLLAANSEWLAFWSAHAKARPDGDVEVRRGRTL